MQDRDPVRPRALRGSPRSGRGGGPAPGPAPAPATEQPSEESWARRGGLGLDGGCRRLEFAVGCELEVADQEGRRVLVVEALRCGDGQLGLLVTPCIESRGRRRRCLGWVLEEFGGRLGHVLLRPGLLGLSLRGALSYGRRRLGRVGMRGLGLGWGVLAACPEGHLCAPAGGLDCDAAARLPGLPLDQLFGFGPRDPDLAELTQVACQRLRIAQLSPQLGRRLHKRPLNLRGDHLGTCSRPGGLLLQVTGR